MDRDSELLYIAKDTENYLRVKGKSLEERLELTHLSESEMNEIKQGLGLKKLRDQGLSLFGNLGGAISTILNWNEEVNQEIGEAKKAFLIESYLNKMDSQEQAILNLKDFIQNPQGNTLFNKIIRIVDDSPPDEELIKHLSSALTFIIRDGDFEELFQQHKYALAQIERLTPQALTIISDSDNWPSIKLGFVSSVGSKVNSDWYSEFTGAYCISKNITDTRSFNRVMHSVVELQRQGFIEAHLTGKSVASCILSQVGLDVRQYLNP